MTGVCAAQACVVDQHVQAAHPRGGRRDQRVDLRGRCDITHHAFDPAQPELRQLVAGLTEPAFMVVGDDDVGPFGECTTRDRRPDAGARSGRHHDDLAVQKAVSVNLFRRFR